MYHSFDYQQYRIKNSHRPTNVTLKGKRFILMNSFGMGCLLEVAVYSKLLLDRATTSIHRHECTPTRRRLPPQVSFFIIITHMDRLHLPFLGVGSPRKVYHQIREGQNTNDASRFVNDDQAVNLAHTYPHHNCDERFF